MGKQYTTKPFSDFSTFVEILRHRAVHQPDNIAYTFLIDGETEQIHLTYSDLDRQARAIAAWLQDRQAMGERVLLLFPPGLDYIAAFFGCLYAGSVAVPVYPPRLNRPEPRLQAIVADSGASVALTTTQIFSRVERRYTHNPALETLQWLVTDNLALDTAGQWQNPNLSGHTLAFLQYTSGSTALPKGVMVSHSNLLHNQRMIQAAFEHSKETIFAGWVPLYHDMGLIGNVLQPMYLGIPCVLMSPLAFLQKPIRWLQAISTFKATTSGGPNFAYDLCVRKTTPEQRATLDLSSWQIAFNGAEPIRSETLERFTATFEPYGFRREAMYPCYGLAEATLIVSGGSKNALPITQTVSGVALKRDQVDDPICEFDDGRTLVGCGQTILNQKIVIANPESLTLCPPNQVGEIWVSGCSVAGGYWNKLEETTATFQAHLADTGEGPFLRTGDLGFLNDGELFVTGRLKDLIIIRGRNFYPQDIERIMEQSHPALRPGCGAAFSIEVNGKERLVVVQEVKRHHRNPDVEEVAQAMRGAIAEDFELQVYAVVLIKPGTIAKTSSGKIQRHASRASFLTDSLAVVGTSLLDDSYFDWSEDGLISLKDTPIAPRTPTEEVMAELWAEVLGLEQVGIYDNFFDLGGQSLLATQIISRIRETFAVELSLRHLFEGVTVAELAKSVDAARRATHNVEAPPIVSVSREEELPLSFSQERMWFLHEFDPDGTAYNIPIAVRFSGPFDVAAMKQSFNAAVQRHETLRTTFHKVDGRPVQIIAPTLTLNLPLIDLRKFPLDKREAEVKQLANQEGHKPFDLAQGPLIRMMVLQVDEEEHILLVNMHHIISDAWTLSVLWQEIAAFYKAFSTGESLSLPELPIQYADFAAWQREWLNRANLESQLAYWKEQLAGAPLLLELPTDRPRPAVQTHRGTFRSVPLPEALLEALRTLSRQEGVTLYMTLLAAFKTLLYRYTGQTDLLVGTPIANRHWLAVEGLLGTFVNTLVMRTDLSGNPTFRELLGRVREVALAAYAHQDLPFEQLVEELHPERNLSHTPLVQVTFNVANAPMPAVHFPNMTWSVVDVDRGAAQFDLSLSMMDTEQIQLMTVEYNTDLFDAETINRMMGHLQMMLEGIITNGPEQRLLDLPLLTETEQQQLLVDWNNTQREYPAELCAHHLFEMQVEQTPEAIAVCFEDEQLTYQELNRRANQLAHHLQGLDVGPEVLVGICVERSLEMAVGLLGILKAGGAYVPLDPENPMDRLYFILEDAQVPILLTQQRLVAKLPTGKSKTICLDTDWQTIAKSGDKNSISQVTPDNLAYVIYTSGSTGRPKGVSILHRGFVNYLTWCAQAYPVEDGTGAPVHSSISFDLTITSLFAPLVAGRQVHLLSNELGVDALGTTLLDGPNFSLVKITPAHLGLLSQQLSPQEAAGRTRSFIIGGENLLTESVAFWQDAAPDTILINEYGPTETVVGCCVYQVSKDTPQSGSIPIGRPIINTQLYILDQNFQPVPVGVPGELYIGGLGVARGYLNRPDLTAEKFVPNPFSDEPGTRMYRTGDLARYLPDGNLEFLGRMDHQVKVRGFRIELGEIESVLKQYSNVQDAVVIVREDVPDDKRLVAYIVLDNREETLSTDEIRGFLRTMLPEYMVPSAFVTLDKLPLTPNGKIDRPALPAPDQIYLALGTDFVIPRDMLELQLVKLWERVLDVRPVGIKDDFFELGGHSLLAVRLFAQIEKLFDKKLPIVTLFRYPTVEQLAAVLLQTGWQSSSSSSLVEIQHGGTKPPIFFAHGMGGGVLDYADLARHLGSDQPVYGLQERAMNSAHKPFDKFEDMAAQYIKEIQTVQPEGPYYLGGFSFGGTLAFEIARQLTAQGQKVALLAVIDNKSPNLEFHQPMWKPRYVIKFFRNLPNWLQNFIQLAPDERLARVKRKVKAFNQMVAKSSVSSNGDTARANIEAILDQDLDEIPESHHKFMEAHYQALVSYEPKDYQGRVTLFRTQGYSLFGPFDPEMGWDKLATSGVEVNKISGIHGTMLQEPTVRDLAQQLRAALDEAQAANDSAK